MATPITTTTDPRAVASRVCPRWRKACAGLRALAAASLLLVPVVGSAAVPAAAATTWRDAPRGMSSWDWRGYGHDAEHTFHGRTTLDETQAKQLHQAWFFPTGDAVTATPTVVDGTVYVGSWDDNFYAISLRTGKLLWKFALNPQPAIRPQPGQVPRDVTTDGGMVTSSAWFQPGGHGRPDLVIFGGGYTLYALDARTGAVFWEHAYTGRPDLPPDPAHDHAQIFSSPVVSGHKVFIGVSVDGERGHRGYIVAASLQTGDPVWTLETDVNDAGTVQNDGCGNIWSSGSLLPRQGLVVFDTADCHGSNSIPLSESVLALRTSDGHIVWSFRPRRTDAGCDIDFGASPNVGLGPDAEARFVGLGGKDGTYYSLDPLNGALRWSTNVVFGGSTGGFIGTSAYDGHHVYGSTALGDFGGPPCDPSNPRDTPIEEPSAHAFDARTGEIAWQETGDQSFAPTTVAGGMTFNGTALGDSIEVRDSATGAPLNQLPLVTNCWAGIATAGDALVTGTGSLYQGSSDGVVAFTPRGQTPAGPGDHS